ncbi:MAG: hypothetical protein ACLFOY_09685 [Desulfatibacillaceae bacterium]
MTEHKKSGPKQDRKRDPDVVGSEAAMKRAALRAREQARAAGIGIIIMQDGEIREVSPDTPME